MYGTAERRGRHVDYSNTLLCIVENHERQVLELAIPHGSFPPRHEQASVKCNYRIQNFNLTLAHLHTLIHTQTHMLYCYQLAPFFAGYLSDLEIVRKLNMAALPEMADFARPRPSQPNFTTATQILPTPDCCGCNTQVIS